MTRRGQARLLGILAIIGLAAGTASAAAVPAAAAVTCPSVDPSTGAVTPAPTPGVNWSGCDLTNAYLVSFDMTGAQLQNSILTGADMAGTDMANADLANATMKNAILAANLYNADLAGANLPGAFGGTNLEHTDLRGASAWGAHLIGADLRHANMQTVDLTFADLTSANLFGATLTGAITTSTTWTDAICPNGASANYYTSGCLSPVSVTTPAGTPTITGGKLGNNGWYVSGVTVTWYWVDSNSLVAAECPASTNSAGQGSAVVVSASCSDSAGHVGTSSDTVKIDTTPPVVTMSGIRRNGVYVFGQFPMAQCATTDTVSGVAEYAATYIGVGGRPDGSGVLTDECVGGKDNAGNIAPTLKVKYTVAYALGGFISPAPGGRLLLSARKITVRFRLADVHGKAIPASTQRALAATYDVRATLRGPGIRPTSTFCSWNGTGKYLQCTITRPRSVRAGTKYWLSATENLGGGFLIAPADPYSQDPAPVYFR